MGGLTLVDRLGIMLRRRIDGETDQRLLAGIDKVVLGTLGNDDQITGIDHLFLSGDDGFALTLGEDQVLVDVVDLKSGQREVQVS